MKQTFVEYLAESKQTYSYVLKLAVDDVSDEMLDKIERALEPYQLVSASEFRRSPIQENPLDFTNVKHSAVHTCDMEISYPSTANFLQRYISGELGIPENYVVVYSEKDPRIGETALYLERNDPKFREEYVRFMGRDPDDDKTDSVDGVKNKDLYGEVHNSALLKDLMKLKSSRVDTTVEGPLSVRQAEPSDVPKDDFNKDLKSDVGLFGRIKATGVRNEWTR